MTDEGQDAATARRHVRYGWASLLLFVTMGAVLEGLHGFKADWYLNVASENRRLMLTLAHAHGTLLGLVHLAFAAGLPALALTAKPRALASTCLSASSVLLPLGFLLGGIFLHGDEPGLGILLVPAGAVLLIIMLVIATRAAWTYGARNRSSG